MIKKAKRISYSTLDLIRKRLSLKFYKNYFKVAIKSQGILASNQRKFFNMTWPYLTLFVCNHSAVVKQIALPYFDIKNLILLLEKNQEVIIYSPRIRFIINNRQESFFSNLLFISDHCDNALIVDEDIYFLLNKRFFCKLKAI